IFGDDNVFLQGQAKYSVKNAGMIDAEAGVHVDARDSGKVLARAGASYQAFSTANEYAAYRKQVRQMENVVLTRDADLSGIDVSESGISIGGQKLDERWVKTVKVAAAEHSKLIVTGEPGVFNTQEGSDVTFQIGMGETSAKLTVAGASKGVVLSDGNVWLIQGADLTVENLTKLALNPGLEVRLKGANPEGRSVQKGTTISTLVIAH